ncbi:MAG: hypothetical protein VB036_14750 [Propionicimonas sp.]|nr:hypothetical protein [Propionicimonas sp.]
MSLKAGLAAVSADQGLTVSADTVHGLADDARLDQWELEASRRALGNLRTLLYGQPMLDLLKDQLDAHDEEFRGYVAASNDEWSECHVVLRADGITLDEALPVIAESMAAMGASGATGFEAKRDAVESVIFPIHPEHYSVLEEVGGVETMGGTPFRTRLFRCAPQDAPDWLTSRMDESYDMSNVGRSTLIDGTPHTWVMQQFKDTDTGVEFDLHVWYPKACPPQYVEEHGQHFPIEVRGLLRIAAAKIAERRASGEDPAAGDGVAIRAPALTEDPSGTWLLQGSVGGSNREMELNLTVTGASASGTLSADGKVIPIEGGTVSGSQVIFTIKLGMKMTLTLEFDGDTATGTMKPGFLPATPLNGTRVA